MHPVLPSDQQTEGMEARSSPFPIAKRRRIDEIVGAASSMSTVGEKELQSAVALASLATLSPLPKKHNLKPETRDADGASWEPRPPPKQDPVPISPEVRPPDIRSKKVHFAPGIKDVQRTGPRRESFPPRVGPQASRMPPGFARGQPRGTLSMQPSRNWAESQVTHFLPDIEVRHGPPNQGGGLHSAHQEEGWVCDYCNVATFPTYDLACAHEQVCRAYYARSQFQRPPFSQGAVLVEPRGSTIPPMGPRSHLRPQGDFLVCAPVHEEPVLASENREWFEGSISLANPKSDPEWLSEINCYVREACVEAFSATEEDVMRNTKRGRISQKQVGIRCCFCKHRQLDERTMGSVSFPASVAGIYESVKRWQRVHLQLCTDVPEDAKSKLDKLNKVNVWIPTTRQYWADSARTLGMVDTDQGIRFGEDVAKIGTTANSNDPPHEESSEASGISDRESLVNSSDMDMIPSYVYFLMKQVESCHFTEADRFVARSKGPVGYPGFQCRHCHGHAGLGKYFPVTAKSLSTNSTSQNVHAHVLKCRKVPTHVKEQLVALKEEKGKAPRLEPGWRKVFFDMIWGRLHGQDQSVEI